MNELVKVTYSRSYESFLYADFFFVLTTRCNLLKLNKTSKMRGREQLPCPVGGMKILSQSDHAPVERVQMLVDADRDICPD